MIVGKITDALDAVVPITILLGANSVIEIDAVLDTGFNGALAISRSLGEQMGLKSTDFTEAMLADGRIMSICCSEVSIEWGGARRDVVAWFLGGSCLIGMELLKGFRLLMDVEPGGDISVESR